MNTALRTLLATGAACAAVGVATAAAGTERPGTPDDEAMVAPPTGFTACVHPGPEVRPGTDEQIEVVLPDGEMTIEQSRGHTWQLRVSDVSDPRLDGTWYTGWDGDQYVGPGDDLAGGPEWAQPRTPYGDQYVGPGDDRGPEFVTFTDLIVNDDGAWQGSAVVLAFPDDRPRFPLVVLIGEGAYEGLTAVVALDDSAGDVSGPCPNTRGYIIEGRRSGATRALPRHGIGTVLQQR